eukprot:TRINITY_DN10127_c0_g1_i2.p1 TRINITY_DN10127_c0_g1~~TRINITY_DN10127_c0_g1_i2.p1  ORF type:complete len:701 (-),score=211.05 TRINITY_DN10127_c0_g1_i2:436-2538(-)
MAELRDLVSGQGCDDGSVSFRNPLANFVDHLYRDKTREQEDGVWTQSHGNAANSRFGPHLSTQTRGPHLEQQVTSFMNSFDEGRFHNVDPLDSFGDMNLNEFDDFHFDRDRRMPHHPGLSDQVPHDLAQEFVDSFVSQSRGQSYRPMPVPDELLRESDKMKMRGHMPLHPGEFQEREYYEQMGPMHPDVRHRDFRETDRWADEFSMLNRERPLSHADMEKYFHEAQHDRWADEFHEHNEQHEFDRHFREGVLLALRLRDEFHEHNEQHEFERHFREANEADRWVEEFEGARPIESVQSLRDLTDTISKIQDPQLQNSKFMQFMHKINRGEVEFRDNEVIEKAPEEVTGEQWAREFDDAQSEGMFRNDWIDEFTNSRESDDWVNDYQTFMSERAWDSTSIHEYVFTDPAENPYITHSNPLEKGMQLFRDGQLSQAILAFEAELHRNPENSQCWHLLGQAHAENDKDDKAIAALIRAVKAEPGNSGAMMALAVSYTNDLYREQALDVLKSWIENHPQYNSIEIREIRDADEEEERGYRQFERYHTEVTDMFIRAARMKPEDPDPEVQTALGLLFNLSQDYSKAVDCFRTALSVKADDYLLWNKLGATLANSNRSEDALKCYFEALSIKPSFVRARANLGISYMALQDFPRAAEYFLQALSMHPEARHLWSNLQMVFRGMSREDLVDRCADNDVDAFRGEFNF